MAKRVAKRETNAQRAEREFERRTTLQMVEWIGDLICRWIKGDLVLKDEDDWHPPKHARLSAWDEKECSPPKVKMMWDPESKPELYTFLGQMFLEFDANIPRFLRLVADRLEGKSPYSPGDDWYDDKITAAYAEALRRMPRPRLVSCGGGISQLIIKRPSFSEFENIFWEQNPKLPKPPSELSLRRSLKRLGLITRPDKRGRPKEK
jgi:hypothetical protein